MEYSYNGPPSLLKQQHFAINIWDGKGKTSKIYVKDNKIVYDGNLTSDKAADIFFTSVYKQIGEIE